MACGRAAHLALGHCTYDPCAHRADQPERECVERKRIGQVSHTARLSHLRERKLLAHKREIKKLSDASAERGVTLVPLAIYFKGGRAKLELGVGRGKRQHDKRESIKKKEMDREVRRAMTHRQ